QTGRLLVELVEQPIPEQGREPQPQDVQDGGNHQPTEVQRMLLQIQVAQIARKLSADRHQDGNGKDGFQDRFQDGPRFAPPRSHRRCIVLDGAESVCLGDGRLHKSVRFDTLIAVSWWSAVWGRRRQSCWARCLLGCHGLVPWRFTLVSKGGTLQALDATALCRGDSRFFLGELSPERNVNLHGTRPW